LKAIHAWLYQPAQSEISRLRLNTQEVEVLREIRMFLQHFHLFQQQLSGERTPTIHLVVPAIEGLMVGLEKAREKQMILRHAYDISLYKLNEYLDKCRVNPVYTVAIGERVPLIIIRHLNSYC
jgi:hypothetical protein